MFRKVRRETSRSVWSRCSSRCKRGSAKKRTLVRNHDRRAFLMPRRAQILRQKRIRSRNSKCCQSHYVGRITKENVYHSAHENPCVVSLLGPMMVFFCYGHRDGGGKGCVGGGPSAWTCGHSPGPHEE